jgi:hypothetical protein
MAPSASDASSHAAAAPTAPSVSLVHRLSLCCRDFVSPAGTITASAALWPPLEPIARPAQADIMLIVMLLASNAPIFHAKPAIKPNASPASLDITSAAALASLVQPAALLAAPIIPAARVSLNFISIILIAISVHHHLAGPVQETTSALIALTSTSSRGLFAWFALIGVLSALMLPSAKSVWWIIS